MHRPRILIFEWFHGGGRFADAATVEPGLLEQGWRMLEQLAIDFNDCGWQVVLPLDTRIRSSDGVRSNLAESVVPIHSAADARSIWTEWVDRVDRVWIIAPETHGWLADCTRRVIQRAEEKLLSAALEEVIRFGCKRTTLEWLAEHNIPAVEWIALPDGVGQRESSSGFVLKPIDGAGGDDVRWLPRWDEVAITIAESHSGRRWHCETYCPGVPASCGWLAGPAPHLFPPARQILDGERVGPYVSSQFDLTPDQIDRAERLARRVANALPTTKGFLGIDLVLGATESDDRVIEINPRLTSGYVAVRPHLASNPIARWIQSIFP